VVPLQAGREEVLLEKKNQKLFLMWRSRPCAIRHASSAINKIEATSSDRA
jgi:hypothetical protein